jgi:hypothetical protein
MTLSEFMEARPGSTLTVSATGHHGRDNWSSWRAVLTYEVSGIYSATGTTPEDALWRLNRLILRNTSDSEA